MFEPSFTEHLFYSMIRTVLTPENSLLSVRCLSGPKSAYREKDFTSCSQKPSPRWLRPWSLKPVTVLRSATYWPGRHASPLQCRPRVGIYTIKRRPECPHHTTIPRIRRLMTLGVRCSRSHPCAPCDPLPPVPALPPQTHRNLIPRHTILHHPAFLRQRTLAITRRRTALLPTRSVRRRIPGHPKAGRRTTLLLSRPHPSRKPRSILALDDQT
jgi:hypothetical protein